MGNRISVIVIHCVWVVWCDFHYSLMFLSWIGSSNHSWAVRCCWTWPAIIPTPRTCCRTRTLVNIGFDALKMLLKRLSSSTLQNSFQLELSDVMWDPVTIVIAIM